MQVLQFLLHSVIFAIATGAALLCASAGSLASPPDWNLLLARGIEARQAGSLIESVDALTAARDSAAGPPERLLANAALGASLLQARRLDQAGNALREAYAGMDGHHKAGVANDLGNLALALNDRVGATRFYQEARSLGSGDPEVDLLAQLNLARLAPASGKAPLSADLLARIRGLAEPATRSRYLLNFAQQAAAMGQDGLALSYAAYSDAIGDAQASGSARLLVEALDALAQLYEDSHRADDARALSERALHTASSAPLGLVQDIVVRLEWRQSRLLKAAGRVDEALAAMHRAAAQLEALRQDLPIEVDGGKTSFASLLRPIYVGLADLILQRQQGGSASERQLAAAQAIGMLELSRQAELQDYLGERCAVLSATADQQSLPAGVAVLYPLVLEDRLELLLKSGSGASYRTVRTGAGVLQRLAADMADGLRSYDSDDYLSPAQQLYNLLLRPVHGELAAAQISTLVIASEGFLRPIPFAALHDGKQFLVEKFALGTVTGMSMTDQTVSQGAVMSSLVVGLSEPGAVLEKLDPAKLLGIAQVARANLQDKSAAERRSAMREALLLPGVEGELSALGRTLGGTRLLNNEFTVQRFSKEATTGNYRILHIASHGVFGGDAGSSFILASDDVLSMNGLQSILRSDNFKRAPIDLLTLSACETAEGNDRAPLGFSGAAIKARARSVLGTLWPVVDDAAQQVMAHFYSGFAAKGFGKAAALRQAQVALLRDAATGHPFYWAPFTLVGNWQ